MNGDQNNKKPARRSFSDPNKPGSPKLHVNQFGHTVLGSLDGNVLPPEDMEVFIDGKGDIAATRKQSMWDHPAMQQFAINAGFDASALTPEEGVPLVSEDEPEEQEEPPYVPASIFDNLPETLEEFNRETEGWEEGMMVPRIHSIEVPTSSKLQRTDITVSVPEKAPASSDTDECCGKQLPDGARFCPHCGVARLNRFCISCGFKFPGAEKFCPECGTRR